MGREVKGVGGDIGDLGEKTESQRWEGAIKPVIPLLSKNEYGRLGSCRYKIVKANQQAKIENIE